VKTRSFLEELRCAGDSAVARWGIGSKAVAGIEGMRWGIGLSAVAGIEGMGWGIGLSAVAGIEALERGGGGPGAKQR
jgi:hypothetical protein